jgi:hypothetical protein
LTSRELKETFQRNDELFFILLEVNESLKALMETNYRRKKFSFDGEGSNERPWVVQITSTSETSSMIFFKEEEISHIYIVGSRITCRGLLSDKNYFDKLIETRSPEIAGNKIISLECLKTAKDCRKTKSVLFSKFASLEPFENDHRSKRSGRVPFENSQMVDERNYNDLMIAIERGDNWAVKADLQHFDLNLQGNDGKRAVDLAFEKEMFDVLVKLLEFDSPFPENFKYFLGAFTIPGKV